MMPAVRGLSPPCPACGTPSSPAGAASAKGLGLAQRRASRRRRARAGGREPARAATALGADAERLVTARQVHGAEATLASRSLGQPGRARGRRARHRPAGPDPGRAHRRLRPGPAGRPEGGRDRRRPCRLEGRAGRRARGRAGRHGPPRRRAERVTAALGPCIAQASYEVGPEFVARFAAEDPANAAFFATGLGPSAVRPRGLRRRAPAPRRRRRRSTCCRTTPAPRTSFSSASGAPRCAARSASACSSPPSRCG